MVPQFDPKQHGVEEYLDVLHIYRARIVRNMEPGDDRIEVRVVPHMIGLPSTDPLPKYPAFFKGQVIHGISEQDDKNKADYVWVAALPDFTVGFVIGLANSYETHTSKFSQSFNYEKAIQKLAQINVGKSYTSYKDLVVQFWTGDYVEMINIKSGDKYIIQSTGNMIVLEKDQIYLRVGSGDAEKDGEKNMFSSIRIGRDVISINAKTIKITGDNVLFGDSGIPLATITAGPLTVSGVTIHPLKNVRS